MGGSWPLVRARFVAPEQPDEIEVLQRMERGDRIANERVLRLLVVLIGLALTVGLFIRGA